MAAVLVGARLFMLDTNIASFIVRGPKEALRARLIATPMAALCVSAITEAELLFGLARRPEATALKIGVHAFLRHVQVLPWDSTVAVVYGDLRATLESRGAPLGTLDTLIAAHALAASSTLVSNDKAMARTPGLQVEDWTLE